MSIPRKRRSTGKVTIADVAQLAGVGTMTVSRALRTPEQVSDKLREKIEAAVHELGYECHDESNNPAFRFFLAG
ncbi:LacI transcriptional regulator [Salmonella enterica subsp. enterica serovar Minnesota str. A4-603]|uniref:Transcriptional regulator, LacI family n=2 Tax=Salmonella enterica I TaxID=59201 RepID=G5QM02_SALRU|nr:LacI transcriptional regulator [Salmonella enterica subsp. enterica serovar Minnesota str. A4-603]EHC85339.1 Transcriptional regulator, LacI family [Salmonella enterica subsp. enterica serovar Rubislaw str. A4-653]